MKKKIIQIEKEYEEKIKDKTEEEIEKIQNEILSNCKEKVEKENAKFYDEKIKNYEKFKSISLENKNVILKLKKILLFRTHSKKTKKRGRKRKNNLINCDDKNQISNSRNKSITKKKYKKLKKSGQNTKIYLTPQNKQLDKYQGNTIPLDEEEDNCINNDRSINNNNHEYSLNKIPYNNGEPNYKYNKFIPVLDPYRNMVLNENEQRNKIDKDNKIFYPTLLNENNVVGNNESTNSFKRTNMDSTDNKSNTQTIINKLINNNFQPINGLIGNKNINMNLNMNINMNINSIQSSSEQNNNGTFSGMKDLRLTTPIKLSQNSSGGAYKVFHKNEGAFNCLGTDKGLEKSAFNKQIVIDTPFPYSNIKTHLCFTSSIKKPVKIVSLDNNNQEQINNASNSIKNNVINNKVNNYFQNIENVTPNKNIDFSGSGSSDGLEYKNIKYSSSKKPEFLNLNSSGRLLNNPFNGFTPNNNITPFKASNANLDKMFFSNLNSKSKQ